MRQFSASLLIEDQLFERLVSDYTELTFFPGKVVVQHNPQVFVEKCTCAIEDGGVDSRKDRKKF